MKTAAKLYTLILLMGVHGYSMAYTTVMDTGEIMPAGQYKMTGETQFITNDDSGMNLSGRFDAGINEEMGFRGQVGFGKTDFFMGGMFKYMPFPDTDTQPAVGFNAGLLYARDRGINLTTIRFEPLVSKHFDTTFGALTPYASLPIGILTGEKNIDGSSSSDLQMQIAFGTQIKTNQWKNVQFMTELGLDLKDAYSYISLGLILYYDPAQGVQWN